MALVKCPECGNSLSEYAKECPNCACPIEYILEGQKVETSIETKGDTNVVKDNSMSIGERAILLSKGACPVCYSCNVQRDIELTQSIKKGESTVRKKSYATRKMNKTGRFAMSIMTAGAWALFTSPKSEYKEISKDKVQYKNVVHCYCRDCGHTWKSKN